MFYDYVSNKTDMFNQVYQKNRDDSTATWLNFYSNNMNIYEGPKDDDG
jgi:hypothetical protein